MAKKILILTLMISALLMLTSCGLDYRYALDESLHNQIELVFEENGNEPSHIIYQGNKYTFSRTTDFVSVDLLDENDVLLSWNGNRYFGYVDEYYSYTLDNPLFIYYKTWVFFNEDYDYMTDTFIIENTDVQIGGEEIFSFEQTSFDFINPVKVELCSKQSPRIKICLELECIEGKWYLSFPTSPNVWIPSDELITILSESGLL